MPHSWHGVQARAIEAARGNVETHYAYICAQVEEFQRRRAPCSLKQGLGVLLMLFSKESTLLFLNEAAERRCILLSLVQVCSAAGYAHRGAGAVRARHGGAGGGGAAARRAGPGLRRACDLLPEAQLREWAAQCQAAHGALNDKARPGCSKRCSGEISTATRVGRPVLGCARRAQ